MRAILAAVLVLGLSGPAWGYTTIKSFYEWYTGDDLERGEQAAAYLGGLSHMQNAMMAGVSSDGRPCKPSAVGVTLDRMFIEHIERNNLVETKPDYPTVVEFMGFYMPLFNCLPEE